MEHTGTPYIVQTYYVDMVYSTAIIKVGTLIYVTGSEKRGNIALTIDCELTIPS